MSLRLAELSTSHGTCLAMHARMYSRRRSLHLRLLLLLVLLMTVVLHCFEVRAAPTDPVITLSPSSLPGVQLVATVMAAHDPLAVVRSARTMIVLRRGDAIVDGEVAAVLDGRVLVRRGGRLELLTLGQAAPPLAPRSTPRVTRGAVRHQVRGLAAAVTPLGNNRYQIERRAWQSALGKVHELARTLRVLPVMRAGRPDGFRVQWLAAGSPLRALGVQRGDVLSAINGHSVATAEELLRIYATLRTASHLSVGLRRGSRVLSLDYLIR